MLFCSEWYIFRQTEKTSVWFTDVCMVSGFLAQHPRQLVVLWAAWRMGGCAGGRRGGGGRTSAGHKEVHMHTLYTVNLPFSVSFAKIPYANLNKWLKWFDSFPIPLSSFLQNDLSSAQRERSAATLPVSHAARYPRQRPGEPDDEFQFISVHRAQHALASRSTL